MDLRGDQPVQAREWFGTLWRDFRLALRTFSKAPVFAATAIGSLALGIGANTLVFSVMKQVVLDSLPVAHPEELVILHEKGVSEGHRYGNGMDSSFSYPLYRDLDANTKQVFTGILARLQTSVALATDKGGEHINCELASGNYFQVLRVKPWRGRLLSPADDDSGGRPVAVLSYGFWQRNFGGDERVLNRGVRLNNFPYTVVGIAPPGFYGIDLGSPPDVFVPMAMKAQITPTWDGLKDRLDRWANLIARCRPGINPARAQSALQVIYPPLVKQDLAFIRTPTESFLKQFAHNNVSLTPGGKGYADMRETLRDPLRFLSVMVAIVLIITVVNVANLLIARAAARQRDMAIRLSVGASRAAVLRQLLVESCTLAFAGGALGVALAYVATPAVLRFFSSSLSESSIHAEPDWRMLLFTAVLALCSGVAFGLLPALQSVRTDVAGALKSEANFGSSSRRLWLRRTLVAAQIAFSMILVSTALLFARSLNNLQHINPGFRTDHLLSFKVNPAGAGYSQERIRFFGEDIRRKVAALPGVENAAAAKLPLLEDTDEGSSITVEGYHPKVHADEEARRNVVSPEFFSTMKIPLLSGRSIQERDATSGSQAAVVNATFAQHFLRGRNPIGTHFGFGSGSGTKLVWTIVGVAADSEHSTLRSKLEPYVYLPYFGAEKLSTLTFYVRTAGEGTALFPSIREIVRRYDASVPLYDLKSMTETVNENLFAERGLGILSIAFAGLATLLAVVGLYGVMSYSVTQREREFGVRMAIGAQPGSILKMVLRESLLVGFAGIVCAVPFVFATGQFVRSSLYAVAPNNPASSLSAAMVLVAVAALAGLIPAARAARIDPRDALRAE